MDHTEGRGWAVQRMVGHDNALQLLCNFSRNLELALKKNKLLKTEAKAQALVRDLLFQDDEGFRDHTPEGSPSEAPSIWGP